MEAIGLYMTIDVTDSHIYLGTGRCSFYCYNNAASQKMVKEQPSL